MHCWQYEPQLGFPLSGDEDCLYLNLYRPVGKPTDKSKPLNVIVFLHGGGFFAGTPHPLLYGPDYFMETGDVILVVTAYRIGAAGFMTTGDQASPGNYGLKDQAMALRWVKDNIAAFGGDPSKVTLMGQSAGAASVNYQLLSKLSEGLFKNAILLSGNIDATWVLPMREPRDFVNRHAAAVGIASPEKLTSEELVEKMRDIPLEDLTEAVSKIKIWDSYPTTEYAPSVEPKGTPGAFIDTDPKELMEKGAIHNVPVYNSIVPNDGLNFVQTFLTPGDKYKDLNEDMYKILPLVLYMNPNNKNIKEIVDKVRFEYFGPTGKVEGEAGMNGLQNMATDYMYGKPFMFFLNQTAKANCKPVYATKWAYEGLISIAPIFTRHTRKYNTSHADDLIQLFRMRMIAQETQLSEDDKTAQKMLMGQIMDFVKNDNPGFDEWTPEEPKWAIVRNDRCSVVARDVVPMDLNEYNVKFWKDIEQIYKKGERRCP